MVMLVAVVLMGDSCRDIGGDGRAEAGGGRGGFVWLVWRGVGPGRKQERGVDVQDAGLAGVRFAGPAAFLFCVCIFGSWYVCFFLSFCVVFVCVFLCFFALI